MEFEKMVNSNKDTLKAILDYDKHFLKESHLNFGSSSNSSDDQEPPLIMDSDR